LNCLGLENNFVCYPVRDISESGIDQVKVILEMRNAIRSGADSYLKKAISWVWQNSRVRAVWFGSLAFGLEPCRWSWHQIEISGCTHFSGEKTERGGEKCYKSSRTLNKFRNTGVRRRCRRGCRARSSKHAHFSFTIRL